MTSRLFLGRLTTLIGRRKLLITGTLAAVALDGPSLAYPVPVIAILMCLAVSDSASDNPSPMSWLAASAPSGARGRATSLRLVGNRTGQVLQPSLAGALAVGTGAAGVLCANRAGLAVIAAPARNLPVDEPGSPIASRGIGDAPAK
jgi:MFS family permease